MMGELQDMGIEVCFARLADPVRDLFTRSGFLEHLGQQRIFRGVGAAVDVFLEKNLPFRPKAHEANGVAELGAGA
jgi:hypothetical protein